MTLVLDFFRQFNIFKAIFDIGKSYFFLMNREILFEITAKV